MDRISARNDGGFLQVTRIIILIAAGICLFLSCKEPDMIESSPLLPKPVAIPFYKGEVNHLFSVIKEKSIGIAYENEQIAIAKIHRDDLELDVFPNNDTFSAYHANGFYQINPDTLFFKDDKFIQMVNVKEKTIIGMFNDASKSIKNHLEYSKIIDYEKGIALSLFYFFPQDSFDMKANYFFVLDDIINRKRIKEVPIPDFISPLSVFFTPSFVFYQYTASDNEFESPWYVIDNDLNQTTHPLAALLNENSKDTVFYVGSGKMKISEERKHALIITYNLILKKDMLYLASWHHDPVIHPIEIDSSLIGNHRLMKNTDNNTMSPSGHWVYFCARAERFDPDRHFLIYLDPELPNGYLPPMRLGLEGTVGCAGWVTDPEGLVLYMNNQLLYYDLSRFDPEKAAQKVPIL
jgi:hypothetical protein